MCTVEATMRLIGQMAKEKLISLEEPKNAVLARIQECLKMDSNKRVNAGYSRMHNRHNRS